MRNSHKRLLEIVICLISLVGFQSSLLSQDAGGITHYLEKSKSFEINGQLTEAIGQLKLALKAPSLTNSDQIAIHLLLSELYEDLGEIDSLKEENDKARRLLNKNSANSLWVTLFLRQAKVKLIDHDSEAAKIILEEALDRALKSGDPILEAAVLRDLSIPFHYEADYTKALNLLQRSERMLLDSKVDKELELGNIYKLYADNWYLLHNIDTALFFYLRAQKVYENRLGPQNRSLLQLNNEIGITLLNLGRIEESVKYIDKTLGNGEKSLIRHPVADAYYYKCQIELELGHPELALGYIKKSVDIFKSIYGDVSYWVSSGHVVIADVYKVLQKYDSAIYHHQLALISNDLSFKDQNIYHNPGYESAMSSIYYLVIVWEKALTLTLLYNQTGEIAALNAARNTFHLALKSLKTLRERYTDEALHIEFGDDVSDLYPDVLECLYQLYDKTSDKKYLDEAFQVAELSKSYILMSSLQKNMTQQRYQSLSELIAVENDITQTITKFENQIEEVNMEDSAVKTEADSLRDLIFLHKERYDSFLVQLKQSHPEYHRLRFELPY